MSSKFGLFVVGKDFAKRFSDHIKDKEIIKWHVLPTKNLNGQYEILYEYREILKND